ncbi:MAG: hypothetical protein JSU07_10530 [Bacteroidetes bacterium]|nr:hypothetical protein [Bacteroidota bacterium]
MKKYILSLIIFVLLVGDSTAQNNLLTAVDNTFGEHLLKLYTNELSFFRANSLNKPIKSISFYNTKTKHTAVYNFNLKNELIEYSSQDKSWFSNTYQHFKFKYTAQGDLNEFVEYNKKNTDSSKYIYNYLTPQLKLSWECFKNTRLTATTLNEYNTDSTLKSTAYYLYKKRNKKIKWRIENDYYTNKQRKQSRYYNAANKVKYIWNYDCDSKGAREDKNETKICKNEGVNSKGQSFYIEFISLPNNKKLKI